MDLSIIIAHYNPENHPNSLQSFHKTLSSICNQKGKFNIEVIIADDGSDYSNKIPHNYSKTIKIENNTYDAIMCVGTFTFGHVKPHALDEFIRISKNKSLICFTINEGIYEEYGFDNKIKELSNNKSWDVKEFFKSDYIVNKDVNAWLCLAKVIK